MIIDIIIMVGENNSDLECICGKIHRCNIDIILLIMKFDISICLMYIYVEKSESRWWVSNTRP